MGTVYRAGRIALIGALTGASVAACGTAAPTASFQTKQVVALGGYGWATGAQALSSSVASAISEIQPVTTNIVGTSPWLGFPGPGALAAGLASPWPTFAGNIGTAGVMNGQMGYLLGLGPLGVPLAPPPLLVGAGITGLASPAGILGWGGLPFVGAWNNLAPGLGAAGFGAPIGPPVGGVPPIGDVPPYPGAGGVPAIGGAGMNGMPGGMGQMPVQNGHMPQSGQQQQMIQQQGMAPSGQGQMNPGSAAPQTM